MSLDRETLAHIEEAAERDVPNMPMPSPRMLARLRELMADVPPNPTEQGGSHEG